MLPDPQAEEPDVGLRTFIPVVELLWYNFPVCELPTRSVWDLILSRLYPSCHVIYCGFFFVFGCRISFLVASSIFLSVVVQQLVVILVFL